MSEEEKTALEAEIAAYMERRFPVGPPTICAFSATGEPYIVLCCGGIKKEGDACRVVATDIEKAVELFKSEFDKYAEGKDGVLYWRRKPDIDIASYPNKFTGGSDCFYQVRARFLISNKQVKEEFK